MLNIKEAGILNMDSNLEKQAAVQEALEIRLQSAKKDKYALNMLLHDYMPFIKKCVSGVFFKGQSKADNLSDAMLAFSHSVKTYNPEKGTFIQYAATVIRNRLLDNVRKELLVQKRFFPFSAKTNEENKVWEANISLQSYDQAEEEKNLRLDIEAVNIEFTKWGFSWNKLLKNCPKQERSRRIAKRIAEAVLKDTSMLADVLKTRQLPITRLAETFPEKALEKYRQYIVALIILSQGDYPYVYSFVPHSFTEEENT